MFGYFGLPHVMGEAIMPGSGKRTKKGTGLLCRAVEGSLLNVPIAAKAS